LTVRLKYGANSYAGMGYDVLSYAIIMQEKLKDTGIGFNKFVYVLLKPKINY